MFYTVAKIFWVIAQPLSVALLLIVAGVVLSLAGKRRLGAGASVAAMLILILCSFTTFGAHLIRPLEARFARPSTMPEQVDTIIVLGGSTLARVSTARGVAELNDAGDRLTEAVALARRYPEARLVYSGGAGILDIGEAEAATAERFFLAQGIEASRLVLEDQSRNTDENAMLTAAMLEESCGQTLLVTSAFHMPRSVALFRKAGFPVVPWPTDYYTSGREGIGLLQDGASDALHNTTTGLREWIGLIAYRLTGRTDELLPSPE